MASIAVSKTVHAGSNPASPANMKQPENLVFSGCLLYPDSALGWVAGIFTYSPGKMGISIGGVNRMKPDGGWV